MKNNRSRLLILAPAVLLAAAILSCSSVGSLPNPFATATPTATATFTPTATPSPTPTSTLTATPLPTGMVLNKLPGGGSTFLDYDGGYSMDIPARWSAVRLEKEDLQDALATAGENNPQIKELLQAAQDAPAGAFRLMAFDQMPQTGAYVVSFNVVMQNNALAAAMPLDSIVAASIQQIKAQIPSLKIKQLDPRANAQGVKLGAAEIGLTLKLPTGQRAEILERQYYFQTDTGIVVVTFSVPAKNASDYFAAFDEVVDSIRLLKP